MMRVAAGAIAKKYLFERYGTRVRGYLARMGDIHMDTIDFNVIETNPFFCPDSDKVVLLENYIQDLRKQGNSIGARINVEALQVPIGLGEPVFDRLDADLAHALMSINAVKGVEIGAGFDSITQLGTEHRDEITPTGFLSNHAGGILGGISTGQTITASVAFKPTSSLPTPASSIDVDGKAIEIVTTGRHDPCVGIRATPIVEAMVAIVLMDHVLRHRGQNADV
jgi:chorismate synthase